MYETLSHEKQPKTFISQIHTPTLLISTEHQQQSIERSLEIKQASKQTKPSTQLKYYIRSGNLQITQNKAKENLAILLNGDIC